MYCATYRQQSVGDLLENTSLVFREFGHTRYDVNWKNVSDRIYL
jgi:hypothetical protein